MRMVSRRRRQNFLVVSVLFVMGGYVYLGLPFHSSPIMVSPTMRRPLGMFLGVSKVILKREKYVPYLILCVNLHHMQYHGCLKKTYQYFACLLGTGQYREPWLLVGASVLRNQLDCKVSIHFKSCEYHLWALLPSKSLLWALRSNTLSCLSFCLALVNPKKSIW